MKAIDDVNPSFSLFDNEIIKGSNKWFLWEIWVPLCGQDIIATNKDVDVWVSMSLIGVIFLKEHDAFRKIYSNKV